MSRTCTAPATAILSAGFGRRLGGVPKSAIRLGGRSLLELQVSALQQAGVDTIVVIVGPYQDRLIPLVKRCQVKLMINESGSSDITTSQVTALRYHVQHHPELDLMVLLGDLPNLTSHHFRRIIDGWMNRAPNVEALVPMAHGVRGHPVILSAQIAKLIAASGSLEAGIRGWMSSAPQAVSFVEMEDSAFVDDIDTPMDLSRIGGKITLPMI